MHVRRSRMLDRLVVGQSIETGTRLPETPTGPSVTDTGLNQLGDVCPVEFVKAAEAAGGPRRDADMADKAGDEAWRYRCAESVRDTAFYACADDAQGACARGFCLGFCLGFRAGFRARGAAVHALR